MQLELQEKIAHLFFDPHLGWFHFVIVHHVEHNVDHHQSIFSQSFLSKFQAWCRFRTRGLCTFWQCLKIQWHENDRQATCFFFTNFPCAQIKRNLIRLRRKRNAICIQWCRPLHRNRNSMLAHSSRCAINMDEFLVLTIEGVAGRKCDLIPKRHLYANFGNLGPLRILDMIFGRFSKVWYHFPLCTVHNDMVIIFK